jgi:hypothetical protein
MTRPVVLTILLVLPVIDLVILAIGALTLKSFKKRHPKISTTSHLNDFKKMVKLHKYLALASMPILWIPGALYGFCLFFLDVVNVIPDLFFVIVPSMVIIGAAKLLNGLQHDVENIPVEGDALKQERDRVVGVWHNQALPDW